MNDTFNHCNSIVHTKNKEKFYIPSSIFSINIHNICFFIILID